MASPNSHYFSDDPNQNCFQQQVLHHFVEPEKSLPTRTNLDDPYNSSMMEQRMTAMNTPDFGPLQSNNLYYVQSSPSSPVLHHISPHPIQLHHHPAAPLLQQPLQQEQKDERTRFVLRLAILLQRLYKMGDQQVDCYSTTAQQQPTTSPPLLMIRKVKQIVRYATQRNRLGDPRFSPLVNSIEQCLGDLVGCDEWFSICLEAEQRYRVRKISQTMMIVSSSMMLGSNNLPSSSSGGANGGQFKPNPSSFPGSFFP